MNIYDLFASFNANRGHVPRRIPPRRIVQDITWPGGRKGMGPTASWEIVGSSQGRHGQCRSNRIRCGNFCWGPILGVKDTNGTTGWWFGINIFFLFHPYLGKIFFNLASYFFKFGLKPPNLTIPVQNDSFRGFFSTPAIPSDPLEKDVPELRFVRCF